MKFFYKAAVRSYAGVLKGLSPFNVKAAKWVSGRVGLANQLKDVDKSAKWIWFHCASLGEFEQGKPVMERFMVQNEDWSLLVTFFSPSGFEVRKNYALAKKVMYLPLENKGNITLFMNRFNPKIAVFVKYEFWYDYMERLFLMKTPLIFISSTFREKQVFFKWYGKWFLKRIGQVDHFFVQDLYSKNLLIENNVTQVDLAGDTRFDRVYDTLLASESFELLESFKQGKKILIFGSAWSKETDFAIQIINSLPSGWKVIYAPHEINSERITSFQNAISHSSGLFTEMQSQDVVETSVLILNTVGHLARCYKYADLAIVGGGFTDGIHNILEPLVFGIPVAFGPIHKKFWEADAAIESEVGFEISDSETAVKFFNRFSSSNELLSETSKKCTEFIKDRVGATKIIGDYLNKLIH